MISNSDDLQYRRLRAPSLEEGFLLEPSASELRSQVESRTASDWFANQLIEAVADGGDDCPFNGLDVAQLRSDARDEIVSKAREYSGEYLSQLCASEWSEYLSTIFENEQAIVMSGHQPELFHPGVWFKNFVLDSLAKSSSWVPINLIVDNDLCLTPSIAIPTGSFEHPNTDHVAFDESIRPTPWENRLTLNEAEFESFPERLKQKLIHGLDSLLVDELWASSERDVIRNKALGYRLAAMRHLLEWRRGLRTLELPLSNVCQTELFRRFASYLILNAESFLETHNRGLEIYRNVHRLRSKTHPVPNLASDLEWTEVPFWIWNDKSAIREPLFVRKRDGDIELRCSAENVWTASCEHLPEFIQELEDSGVVIRTRALTTTMFSRLFLSDCFIHGIGGAKYDQLTDWLIRNWFQLTPPPIETATASVALPFDVEVVTTKHVRDAEQQKRDMRYHPENFLDEEAISDELQELVDRKKELVHNRPEAPPRKMWHDAIETINSRLQDELVEARATHQKKIETLSSEKQRQGLLLSREWSFVLFQNDELVERLKSFASTVTPKAACR